MHRQKNKSERVCIFFQKMIDLQDVLYDIDLFYKGGKYCDEKAKENH